MNLESLPIVHRKFASWRDCFKAIGVEGLGSRVEDYGLKFHAQGLGLGFWVWDF